MKFKIMTTVFTLVPLAGIAAATLSLTTGAASVSAQSGRSGDLHVAKTCPPSTATGLPGQYCTIIASNLAEIPPGSKVFYTQGGVTAAPESGDIAFDSNLVLFVGFGDWAVGRCTLDSRQYPGNHGLCTFSNGVGPLAGFTAHVNVSPFQNTPTDINYYWNRTYSFNPEFGR